MKKGDTVKFTESAKRILPILKDDNKEYIIKKVEFENDKFECVSFEEGHMFTTFHSSFLELVKSAEKKRNLYRKKLQQLFTFYPKENEIQ